MPHGSFSPTAPNTADRAMPRAPPIRPGMANTFYRRHCGHHDRELVGHDPRACTHICIREFHNCLLPLLVRPAGNATSLTSIIAYRQSPCAPQQASPPRGRRGARRSVVKDPLRALHAPRRDAPRQRENTVLLGHNCKEWRQDPRRSRGGESRTRVSTAGRADDRATTSAIDCGAMIRLYCLVLNKGTIPAVVYRRQSSQAWHAPLFEGTVPTILVE
jgi:hypothetical protein